MIKSAPTTEQIIEKYYPAGQPLRDIYLRHCTSVALLALQIAEKLHLPLDLRMVADAAMLHDIGIYATHAPSIECRGTEPYICHGIIGAALLRREGAPEEYARVAELHTGAGLTAADIEAQHLPLPSRDYLPESLLEKLICYADKFYSKSGSMERKSLESVRRSMERHGTATLARFEELHRLFGPGL